MNMKINSENNINYTEYEQKCLEIFNYFDGLYVMEKLTGENNIKINVMKNEPLLYDIVFFNNKDYFIFRSHSIVKGQYIPQFSCMFLYSIAWNERIGMFNGEYSFGRLCNRIKCEYENFYRREHDYDFLEFKKIEISQSVYTMSDDVRVKYNIKDVNVDKILFLKELMEKNEKR